MNGNSARSMASISSSSSVLRDVLGPLGLEYLNPVDDPRNQS
jgi:hypothetical protein